MSKEQWIMGQAKKHWYCPHCVKEYLPEVSVSLDTITADNVGDFLADYFWDERLYPKREFRVIVDKAQHGRTIREEFQYDVYAADQRFGLHLAKNDPHTMTGYHIWAEPLADAMKTSRLLTLIVHHSFAKAWAQEMFAREVITEKGSLRGKLLIAVGIPFCRWIGKQKKPGALLRAF